MEKIALIVPRAYNHKETYKEYPLGVGYLGTILARKGYGVKIFDQNIESLSNEELIDKLKNYDPKVIGFSVITPTYLTAVEIIKEIRKTSLRDRHIIGGGLHATLFPVKALDDGFDLIAKGAGESNIVNIIKSIDDKETLKAIPGLVFRDESGNLINNESIVNCTKLKDLPIVDRSLYNIDLYTHHSIAASRGCFYRCKFCCNYSGTILNNGVSVRDIDDVIEEIIYLQNNFKARDIFFVDDIFFLEKERIIKFCKEIIERKLKFNWYAQLRIDSVNQEVANYLRAANCQRVYFGVECGSDSILSRVNKKINRKQILEAIQYIKKAGIRVKTGWIYGLPGSMEEQRESIELMLEARPNDISIHKLIPFPGTEYYNHSEKYGIKIKDKGDLRSFSFSGLNSNFDFSYMNEDEYIKLLLETGERLEKAGYVSSDRARGSDEYIYTTPLSKRSIKVVKEVTS